MSELISPPCLVYSCGLSLATAATPKLLSCTTTSAASLSRPAASAESRQAMRELGVPFLRRWIMWAAVRLGALTNPAGRKKWWTEAWRVALIAAVALPVITPAAAVIVVSLVVFYLVEFVVWIPLEAAHGIRKRRH